MIKEVIMLCALYYSQVYDIPSKLILAVAKTESNFEPMAVGKDRMDIGLMQIRHIYTKETPVELKDSCLNIRTGARILAEVRKSCRFQKDYTYLICYNRGIAGANQKDINPKQDRYYKAVMQNLKELYEFEKIETTIKQTLFKKVSIIPSQKSWDNSCCIYR